jgi:hypothetical protein
MTSAARLACAAACAPALCVLLLTPRAHADGETREQTADRLFREASRLEDGGDFASACQKLQQSNELDPAIGTQFNLADCYEHMGQTGRAFTLFRSVQAIAKAAGKVEREASARARADVLEPRVARIRVELGPGADAPGLEVRRDATLLTRGELRVAVVTDPGAHTVTAQAPGRARFSTVIRVSGGAEARVVVPPLAASGPAAVSAKDAPPPTGHGPTALAVITGLVGLAGLGTGTVAGTISLMDHAKAKLVCPTFVCADAAGASEWSSAVTWGTVSTVAFVVGGVGIAGASVLWLTAPSGRGTSTAAVAVHGVF